MIEGAQNIFSIETLRDSGEVFEVSEIAEASGFGIPIFLSNSLRTELTPEPVVYQHGVNPKDMITGLLDLLYAYSQRNDHQDIRLAYSIPTWDMAAEEISTKDLDVLATIYVMNEQPFVILANYEEVADIVEGKPRSD